MLAYVASDAIDSLKLQPELDRDAASALAKKLFPSDVLEPIKDGDLSYTSPPDDELHIGCFPGIRIVAAKEFGIDYPSKLDAHFLEASDGRLIYLHAMHSVVDWFAFAIWENGKLVRSLSLSPEDGILEDIGAKLPFELPFWAGENPALDPEEEQEYPLPFHPLDLGEAALLALFGYQIEGFLDSNIVQPELITLACYKRKKKGLKF